MSSVSLSLIQILPYHYLSHYFLEPSGPWGICLLWPVGNPASQFSTRCTRTCFWSEHQTSYTDIRYQHHSADTQKHLSVGVVSDYVLTNSSGIKVSMILFSPGLTNQTKGPRLHHGWIYQRRLSSGRGNTLPDLWPEAVDVALFHRFTHNFPPLPHIRVEVG